MRKITMHARYMILYIYNLDVWTCYSQVYAWKKTKDEWTSVKIPPFRIPRKFACVDVTDEGIIVRGGIQHQPPKPPCHFSSEVLDQAHPERGWSLIEHTVSDKSSCERAYLCYSQKIVKIPCKWINASCSAFCRQISLRQLNYGTISFKIVETEFSLQINVLSSLF